MMPGREWFSQKRYGYGAGLPIAWQGWTVLGLYMAVVGLTVWLLEDRPLAIAAILVPATLVIVLVSAVTTRGGWRWRWGRKD